MTKFDDLVKAVGEVDYTVFAFSYTFTFKNGYYELDGSKIQIVKVKYADLWVVVDAAFNDTIQQSNCLSLEDAKKAAIKMFERQKELKCPSTK